MCITYQPGARLPRPAYTRSTPASWTRYQQLYLDNSNMSIYYLTYWSCPIQPGITMRSATAARRRKAPSGERGHVRYCPLRRVCVASHGPTLMEACAEERGGSTDDGGALWNRASA